MVRKTFFRFVFVFSITLGLITGGCSNSSKPDSTSTSNLGSSTSVFDQQGGSDNPFGGIPIDPSEEDEIIQELLNTTPGDAGCVFQASHIQSAPTNTLQTVIFYGDESFANKNIWIFTNLSQNLISPFIYNKDDLLAGNFFLYKITLDNSGSFQYTTSPIPAQNSWFAATKGPLCTTLGNGNLEQVEFVDQNFNAGQGDEIEVTVSEIDGQTTNNAVIAFGQLFRKGDYPGPVALQDTTSGVLLPTQVNILRSHDDGSIRHALISTVAPQLGAGQNLNLRLVRESLPGQSQNLGFNANDLNAEIILTGPSGTYKSQLNDVLSNPVNCVANSGTPGASASWRINGPIVKQCVAWARMKNNNGSDNAHLDVSWRLRFYAGKNVHIEAVVENTHINAYGNSFQDYMNLTGTFKVAGATKWNYGPINLAIGTRFQTPDTVFFGQANADPDIIRDMNYLVQDVHAFPAIRGPVTQGDFQSLKNKINANSNWLEQGQLGENKAWMPSSGGGDMIGAFRTSERIALALQSRDSLRLVASSDINSLGTYDTNYRKSANGGQQVPGGIVGINCGDWDNQQESPVESGATVTPDIAHQPSMGYVSYSLQPMRYFAALESLQFWTTWTFAREYPYNCEIFSQVRATAWSLRNLTRAAYIAPDNDPRKDYFIDLLEDWLVTWDEITVNAGLPNGFHIYEGAASKGLVKSGQPHEVNTSRVAAWQYAWVCYSLVQAVKLGYPQALDNAQWVCKHVIDEYTKGDNPANNWTLPETGEVFTWNWVNGAGTYRQPAYYFPESQPNTMECDANAWTIYYENNWTRTPVVNWGQRQYLHKVEYGFGGYPTPFWCPTYPNGTPMTFWDIDFAPNPIDDPLLGSWRQYAHESAIPSLFDLMDLSNNYLNYSLNDVKNKVNTSFARYESDAEVEDTDLWYEPLNVF